MRTKRRIVVIDDDEWLVDTYTHTLAKAGYEVARAANALEAVQVIDTFQPDVIILDIFMPGPNGVALLHELQSYPDLARIPVIVVTNAARDIRHGALTPYGVQAVLDKTAMTPEDILLAVKRVML